MRARSQRTHQMGSSNRQILNSLQKTESIHERSFNKSAILQHTNKLLHSQTSSNHNPQKSFQKTNRSVTLKQNPFNGSNVELQSARFDKMNLRSYRYAESKPTYQPKPIMKDFSHRVNQKIQQTKRQYEGKNVNTQKLYLLKQAILKNNRDRVHFRDYFNSFVDGQQQQKEQKILSKGFKKFIKSFGYDLNNQEISLFLKLNNINNNNSNISQESKHDPKIKLDMKNFIELCTNDNIYFKTITLNEKDQHKLSQKSFKPSHFEILRNKFSKLKEAFKIYSTRNQPITYEQFTYTMKKLDINDLIMPKPQRDQLFMKFSDQIGNFNAQKLLGAIAAHYNEQKSQVKQKTGFQNNLKFIQQQQAQKAKLKQPKYNLKKSSVIQYERHLQNARTILNQIRELSSNDKHVKQQILGSVSQNYTIYKKDLRKNLQNYMMSKGFSLRSQKYQSLIGYLDFDSRGNISKNQLENFLFDETYQEAEGRIQRQTRNLPPLTTYQRKPIQSESNIQKAAKVLKSLKQACLNPQISCLFKSFDKDKDGYISREEFNKNLREILVNESETNIENLSSYFYGSKNHLRRDDFATKYQLDEHVQVETERLKSKSIFEYNDFRKNQISELKQSNKIYRPTKYSAWPQHLHQHNLSLIQASNYSNIYINETQRFNNSQKHYYALEQKLQRHRKRNAKIAKMTARNVQKQERKKEQIQNQIEREGNKNFKVRLVREQYNNNLIENYQ